MTSNNQQDLNYVEYTVPTKFGDSIISDKPEPNVTKLQLEAL